MNGFIIDLLKDVQENNSRTNEELMKNCPHLVWMYYDRVHIKKIDSMSDYFLSSETRNNWTGSVQSLHLYNNESVPINISNKLDELLVLDNGLCPCYIGITVVKLSNELKDILEWGSDENSKKLNSDIYDYLKRSLDKFPAVKKGDLSCSIFKSFGAEDFAIVFLGDSLKVFANAIEGLRSLRYTYTEHNKNPKTSKLLVSTYSFVAQNNLKDNTNPKLKASVAITLRENIDKSQFLTDLKKELGYDKREHNDGEFDKLYDYCFGEHDVRVKLNNSDEVMGYYNPKNGFLRATSAFYEKYIYQSRTTWVYNENDIDINWIKNAPSLTFDLSSDICKTIKNCCTINPKNIEQDIEKFKELIDCPLINRLPYFKEEWNILLSEYKQQISSTFVGQWRVDLRWQFSTFLYCLEKFLEQNNNFFADHGLTSLKNVMEDLKETYLHINQAGRLVFESLGTTNYYSGSYSNILRAYYGFIRLIFSIGYMIPHKNETNQSIIAYTVNFDVTSKIYSHLHLLTEENLDKRIVSFKLPYDALYNMPKYMFYLIHEVFHYIAPIDRKARNKLLLKICVEITVKELLSSAFKILFSNLETIQSKENDYINRYLSNIINDEIETAIGNDTYIQEILGYSSDFFGFKVEELFYTKSLDSNRFYTIVKNIILKTPELENSQFSQHLQEIINAEKTKKEASVSSAVMQACENFYENKQGKSMDTIRQELYDGLSEVICDYYTVQILNIDFLQYIDGLVSLIDDLMYDSMYEEEADIKKINTYSSRMSSIAFRIGVFADLFYRMSDCYNKKNIQEWFYQEIDNWAQKTHHISNWNNEKNVEQKAQFLKICYLRYSKSYKGYRNNIQNYLDYYRLENIVADLKKNHEDGNIWEQKFNKELQIIRGFSSQYNIINSISDTETLVLNADMVEYFQYQRPIYGENMLFPHRMQVETNIPRSINPIKTKSTSSLNITVSNVGEYMEAVTDAICKLQANVNGNRVQYPMWFRGSCNFKWELEPSIYRNIPKNIKYTSDYLVALFKEIHAQTAQYPDVLGTKNVIEQLCCMQHYSAPTNLLDFSVDALTALHFALNPDVEEDKKNIVDASVYILHPLLFNNAMKTLESGVKNNDNIYPIVCSGLLKDEELLPYIPDSFGEQAISNGGKHGDTILPRALIVPMTNQRVKNQNGTFIAYNIKDEPSNRKTIDELEREYINKFNRSGFMCKVNISASALASIRDQLRSIGITTHKMYPELDRIFKSATAFVKSNTIDKT